MSALMYSCADFLGFQEALKRMRDIDDKIIYALNSTLPTESFKGQTNSEKTCKGLRELLQNGYQRRDDAIRGCIKISAETLKELRVQHDRQPDDADIARKFKSEQRKLRVLQSELNVEDIVKERSMKALNARCRAYLQAEST